MTSRGWDVYAPFRMFGETAIQYKHMDTVFFDASMDADEVKRSLVEHDGYPADIMVRCGEDGVAGRTTFDDDER